MSATCDSVCVVLLSSRTACRRIWCDVLHATAARPAPDICPRADGELRNSRARVTTARANARVVDPATRTCESRSLAPGAANAPDSCQEHRVEAESALPAVDAELTGRTRRASLRNTTAGEEVAVVRPFQSHSSCSIRDIFLSHCR